MTHTHQLVLTASDGEIDAAVLPFVLEARTAGEPTVLSLAPRTAAAVRDRVGTWAGLALPPGGSAGRRPGTDLARFGRLVEQCMAEGRRVRVVNEVPSALYRNWEQWRRYEAVVNVAHAGLDAWGLCVYDERRLSPDMVEDLRSTHPFIGLGLDRRANPDYQDPRAFCDAHLDGPPDPVEQSQPTLELLDPSPATARAAVRDLVTGQAGWGCDDVEALVLAAHEALVNAVLHGRPPVTLRGWVTPARGVVTVHDTGRGPQDGFVGLLYSPDRAGMWLSHQLVDVAHRRDEGGYTVRMTARAGHALC